MTIVGSSIHQKKLQAQVAPLRDLAAVKEVGLPKKSKNEDFDKKLIIANPLHGKTVTGKIKITGRATPNTSVKIDVTATYFKYVHNYKTKTLIKGDGPFNVKVKNIILKANASGNWSTTPVSFDNYGFSTIYKIVAKSVEGKNITYNLVENNMLDIALD